MEVTLRTPSTAITSRSADFWLLGGASIALWAVMGIAQLTRGHSESIENHILQVSVFFSLMSVFCNYPHFIISYRFGYGRGRSFIFQHWFSLIFVPLALLALYALAYLKFDYQFANQAWVSSANQIFEKTGTGFRLGTLANSGTEILSLSILLMNLTVGWHYSKQVFGCMMVYGHYDRYQFSPIQRVLVKASLFSVAFFNFFYISSYLFGKSTMMNVPPIPLAFPSFLIPLTGGLVAVLALATGYFVFYGNYRKTGKLPSPNLLVPWVAFHVWWIPLLGTNDYYFGAVPFFHSLQYLPFALRVESQGIKRQAWREFEISVKLALLVFVGFCVFELVPNFLDKTFQTPWYMETWFFMVSFTVFINIHHFFIDSVVWKFKQPEIREKLLTRG